MKTNLRNTLYSVIVVAFSYFSLVGKANGQNSGLSSENTPRYEYIWKQQFYGFLDKERSLLFAESMPMAKPVLADINSSGNLDILVGSEKGNIAFYQYEGLDGDIPKYELMTQHIRYIDYDNVNKPIDVGSRAAPFILDYENNNRPDLFVANAEGLVTFFQNIGSPQAPIFQLATKNFFQRSLGENLVVAVADLNNDGLPDLVLGDKSGKIRLMKNTGTIPKPSFADPVILADLAPEYNTFPAISDRDGNDLPDILVGTQRGRLIYLKNIGNSNEPKFERDADFFTGMDIHGESAPVFYPTPTPSRDSLFVFNNTDKVNFYVYDFDEVTNTNGYRNLTDNLFNKKRWVNYGTQANLSTVDFFLDNGTSIIASEEEGKVNLFRNLNPGKTPNWTQVSDDLLPKYRFEDPSLTVGNLNDKGLPDLLIGNKNGNIIHFRHNGSKENPAFNLVNLSFENIQTENPASPYLNDFDQDKLTDLFVAEGNGKINLYKNIGDLALPFFPNPESIFYTPVVESRPRITMFDWNRNGKMAVLLGNGAGTLLLWPSLSQGPRFLSGPNDNVNLMSDGTTSLSPPISLNYIDLPPEIQQTAPLAIDYNNDNEMDLMVGTGDGDVLLFINQGFQELKPLPKYEVKAAGVIRPNFEKQTILLKTNQPRINPTLGQLHKKRALDLIFGTANGDVFIVKNEGNSTNPVFKRDQIKLLFKIPGKNASPYLFDINANGKLDLLVGNKEGEILLYENIGTQEVPDFSATPGVFRNLRVNRNATPAAFIMPSKEKLLLSGDILGKLIRLDLRKNQFGRFEMSVLNRNFLGVDVGIASSPKLADLYNDGLPEIVIGADNGKITFLENTTKSLENANWTIPNDYGINFPLPEGTFPSVADLDDDDDQDLIVGTMKGDILYIENKAVVKP